MADFQLSYVDFLPQCLSGVGFFKLPKYERFDVLILRCNDWLAQNPGVKISTCESIEIPWRTYSPDGTVLEVDNDASMFYEGGKTGNAFIRGLRLWILPKVAGDDPNPVRLGYYNIVPACTNPGGIFKMPKFEGFDVTLRKVNEIFKENPLQGKIINIETQDMKFQAWGQGVDPDDSYWFEYGEGATCYLNCLRIFYAGGQPAFESIGSVDIVPTVSGSGFKIIGERFGALVQRADAWIKQYPGVRVTNVQSINYKMSLSIWKANVQAIDTMQTLYYKTGKGCTVFCRILRICYVMPMDQSMYANLAPPQLTYRNFSPSMIRPPGGMFSFNPKYETVTQNMGRLVAWLRHTGAQVISVETCQIIMRQGGTDPEETITYDSGSTVDVWLTVLRIYLDGHYTDPPLEALPAPPPMEEPKSVGCCAIL